jgi:hypothetical protein
VVEQNKPQSFLKFHLQVEFAAAVGKRLHLPVHESNSFSDQTEVFPQIDDLQILDCSDPATYRSRFCSKQDLPLRHHSRRRIDLESKARLADNQGPQPYTGRDAVFKTQIANCLRAASYEHEESHSRAVDVSLCFCCCPTD